MNTDINTNSTTPNVEEIIAYYKKMFPFLEMEDIQDALDVISFRKLKKGEFFVQFEEYNDNIFFVVNGLLKAFYLDDNDNEVIINFYKEMDLSGNWYSTLKREASNLCIRAIEPTVLIIAPIEKVEELTENNRNMLKAYNGVLKRKLVNSLEHIWEQMNEKPEIRYRRFLEEKPELADRVKQKDLAAYLGITAVSMSRMKKRMEGE